ncbi:MAG: NPCBM/NEW2 domain-containing protein, partial [Planctomycetes bacterium]|nr:NPCBM/NEW2 domain-containing protein [Planctomycetota bacterium]
MSRSSPALLLACGALLCAAAPAQAAGKVRTIDGRQLTGVLTVAEDGTATVADDAGETRIELAELVSFERDGAEVRNVQTEDRVWLRSGPELPAKKLTGRAGADGKPSVLIARLPCGAELELPISTLRAIRHGGLMRPQPTLFAQDLAEPPANDDVIYVVRDGQAQRSLVGVTAIREQAIDFRLRGDEYEFELDGLAGVVFGVNTGFAPDRQPRPRTVVALTTGERIEGRLLSLGERVRCRLDEGCVLDVPVSRLFRLEVSSDKLVWLADLDPKVEQTPAFDRTWPWHNNRSVAGPGFELGGQRFERGIGMVPRTRLTYALDGRFDVFEAMIGIDDRGGPAAHAVFRVHVDGKQVFESPPMVRDQKPQSVRVALDKARSLTIEVDFGKNYD